MLNFTTNFNNKLYCKAFITLRPGDYKVGDVHDIHLNDVFIGKAEVIDVKPVDVNKLSNFMSYLDSGYSIVECRDIISKMYKDKVLFINLILLVYHGKPINPVNVKYEFELQSGKKVKHTLNLDQLEQGMFENLKHGHHHDGDPVKVVLSRKVL